MWPHPKRQRLCVHSKLMGLNSSLTTLADPESPNSYFLHNVFTLAFFPKQYFLHFRVVLKLFATGQLPFKTYNCVINCHIGGQVERCQIGILVI